MATYFISDLHLSDERPQLTRAFFQFLESLQNQAKQLYILGDFFDAWVGDDDDRSLVTSVAEALSRLAVTGCDIFLMHGNRDFLMGDKFAVACGAKILAENSVIDLYGTPCLLLHGDSLCTGDAAYMQFRQQVRSPEWQAMILAQPLAARRALAAQLREKSQAMNSLKAEDIMDVTPSEVVRALEEAKVNCMIHGHTHRPATHRLELSGQQPATRWVLGDWHDSAWAIKADATGINLYQWPIT